LGLDFHRKINDSNKLLSICRLRAPTQPNRRPGSRTRSRNRRYPPAAPTTPRHRLRERRSRNCCPRFDISFFFEGRKVAIRSPHSVLGLFFLSRLMQITVHWRSFVLFFFSLIDKFIHPSVLRGTRTRKTIGNARQSMRDNFSLLPKTGLRSVTKSSVYRYFWFSGINLENTR
jgi:hypothetical protein